MSSRNDGASRRALLKGAALMAAMTPAVADARTPNRAAIQRTVRGIKEQTVAQIQDWIRNPSIAAENLNMQEGAEYMRRLAVNAGFTHTEIVQTSGHPGVFATWDVGAPKTLGVYFMYDVKQFTPSEWSSPPLEARLVENRRGPIF